MTRLYRSYNGLLTQKLVSRQQISNYFKNCGQNRTDQINHCDHIKKCREQILRGETEQTDLNPHSDDSNHNHDPIDDHKPVTEDESDTDIEQNEDSGNRRVRKRPFWAKDYVFSCRMLNTKQTPRKHNSMADAAKTWCTWCKGLFEPGASFEQHIVVYYRNRWTCRTCGQTFKQKSYLDKYKRTQHNIQTISSLAKNLKTASSTFSVAKPVKSADKNNETVDQVNVDGKKKGSDETGCKLKRQIVWF